jgi:hypothetical protein
MKSILYAGAVLMAGACIYGFTDYRKTSSNSGFKEMYSEEAKKTTTPVVAVEEQPDVVPVPEITISKMKASTRSKEVRPDEDVKSIRPIAESERIEGGDVAKIEKAEVTVTPPEKMSIRKKKKKLNSKMFSRAPIREEHEDLILVPGEKKETPAVKASKEL